MQYGLPSASKERAPLAIRENQSHVALFSPVSSKAPTCKTSTKKEKANLSPPNAYCMPSKKQPRSSSLQKREALSDASIRTLNHLPVEASVEIGSPLPAPKPQLKPEHAQQQSLLMPKIDMQVVLNTQRRDEDISFFQREFMQDSSYVEESKESHLLSSLPQQQREAKLSQDSFNLVQEKTLTTSLNSLKERVSLVVQHKDHISQGSLRQSNSCSEKKSNSSIKQTNNLQLDEVDRGVGDLQEDNKNLDMFAAISPTEKSMMTCRQGETNESVRMNFGKVSYADTSVSRQAEPEKF